MMLGTVVVTAACTACGGHAEKMHQPVFHRGTFRPKCCPVCGENAPATQPTQQAPLRGVVAASAVRRRAATPTQGTSQFRDDGWGHRPNRSVGPRPRPPAAASQVGAAASALVPIEIESVPIHFEPSGSKMHKSTGDAGVSCFAPLSTTIRFQMKDSY
jgi:hypothetical protein